MEHVIFAIKYIVAILPYFIFIEATEKFAKILKKKGIYDGWDQWHSLLVVLILLAIILYSAGVR